MVEHAGRLVIAFGLVVLASACGDERAPQPGEGAQADASTSAAASTDASADGEREPEPAYGEAILELGDPELAPFTGDLDAIAERRVLRALVAPSRTDFFLDHGAIQGIQAEMLRELAKSLNAERKRAHEQIRVKFVPVAFADLLPALEAGKGDLVAHFLTPTPARRARVDLVPAFRSGVAEVVVAHREAPPITEAADLAGREVHVLRGSSYATHLAELSAELRAQGRQPIRIVEADARLEAEDLLELVSCGTVELTVVDDYKAELWGRVLPGLRVHHDVTISRGRPVGWAVRKGSPQLRAAVAAFVDRTRAGTLLGNVWFQRYFRNVRWVEDPTARSERDKLRRYIGLFERFGSEYGFEPLALAAQAYQESRLDHSRRSARGAVGIMQLLPTTARDPNVGIPDISRVEDNVHAGARYLAFLRDRYFSEAGIEPWDRAAMSFAAYNAGPRRIREARSLAERMGLDTNVWFDNVELAVGRSVGREPVRYVANIYRYFIAYRLLQEREREREQAVGAG